MSSRKRFSIGLQIDHLSSGYAGALVDNIKKHVEERDCNFYIFIGSNLGHPSDYEYQQNVIYNYIQSCKLDTLILATGTLCNFVTPDKFQEFTNTLKGLPLVSLSIPLEGIPSIVVDNKAGIMEAIDHLITVHRCSRIAFIKGPDDNPEAQIRFQAYLDAHKSAGIPVCDELIIPGKFTPPCGIAGAEYLIQNKIEFDALMAANDDMALTAMETFEANGMSAPDYVKIIGFDDSEYAQYSSPPLSSVTQQLQKQAEMAVQLAYDICQGIDVPLITTVDTKLIVRFSCGCFPSAISQISTIRNDSNIVKNRSSYFDCKEYIKSRTSDEQVIEEKYLKKLCVLIDDVVTGACPENQFLTFFQSVLSREVNRGSDITIWHDVLNVLYRKYSDKAYKQEFLVKVGDLFQQSRILLSDMIKLFQGKKKETYRQNIIQFRGAMQRLISALDKDAFVEQFQTQLHAFGLRSCYISYYQKQIIHNLGDIWKTPENLELILACDDTNSLSGNDCERVYSIENGIVPVGVLPANRRYTFIISALYCNEEQLGFTIFEPTDRDGIFYETFLTQLRNIFKSMLLFSAKEHAEKELKEALKALEITNEKLSKISQTDELTGLYNRRGFVLFAQQSMNLAIQMGKRGHVIFADLDGLKQINDKYGHKEGDFAIREAAAILRKTFRNMDLIGRMGGDEFTIMTLNTDDSFVTIMEQRLNQQLKNSNDSINKPYKIGISTGAVSFGEESIKSLESLLAKADDLLYNQKRNKKVNDSRK